MTDILDLPGWKVLNKTLDQDGYLIEAEFTEQPNVCQKCGVIGRLYLHGPKPVIYRDSPIRGNAVRLLARVQRYRCRDCDETFMQPLYGVEPNRRLTNRCIEYIASQCLRDTFIRLALHVGCDEKTIRNVANDYIEALNARHNLYLPEWLGIDETGIDGKMRCVLTDVVERVPIDMLGNRDKGTLATWLNHFRDRDHVQGVAIDMWRPYKTVADLLLPNRPVIIDKFHVVRMANYAMEKVRIRLGRDQRPAVKVNWLRNKALLNKRPHNLSEQQKFALGMWLDNEPEIAKAYRLKEAFYGIYDLAGQQQAGDALDAWRASIPAFMAPDFKELLSATKNWRPEILAYFDYPVTNGYTEAVNGTAKVINRAGRGYTFEVLRARVLFGKDRIKPSKLKPMAATDLYDLGGLAPPPELVAEEPKAKGCWTPDQKLRRTLLRQEKNRCMSCKGVFDPQDLYVTRMGPLMDGEPEVNAALLCGTCKVRFHTGTLQAL